MTKILKISYENIMEDRSFLPVFTKLCLILIILYPLVSSAAEKEPLGINLENYKYPFEVDYMELDSQGQSLIMAYMYEKAADKTKGTVLLFHGKNFCGAYWGETMKYLKDKGYNVLVPDQIGFCKSSKPALYQYSFHQLAQNTRTLTEKLGLENIIVMGHSMGGMLATRYALMYPDSVKQLILENPIGLEDWKLMVPYVDIDHWYESELKRSYEGVKQYMRRNYFDGKWKEKYDERVYLLTGMKNSPDYPRYARTSALIYDMIFTQPVLYEFDQLKVPAVLIIGQRDRTALGKNMVDESTAKKMGNYPELGKKTCNLIPDCTLIELDDIGHLPHIENFSLFRRKLSEVIQ